MTNQIKNVIIKILYISIAMKGTRTPKPGLEETPQIGLTNQTTEDAELKPLRDQLDTLAQLVAKQGGSVNDLRSWMKALKPAEKADSMAIFEKEHPAIKTELTGGDIKTLVDEGILPVEYFEESLWSQFDLEASIETADGKLVSFKLRSKDNTHTLILALPTRKDLAKLPLLFC